ncbi:MAG: 4Fe-4S binding protein [Eubacteriales bacterium]
MDLKKFIKDYAKTNGIDLIGFASKERFESVAPANNPFSIFPEGKTVILIGKRICRGSLRGIEEGSNFGDYGMFGSSWLEDEFLAIACYDITRVLENEGWEACPVFPNPTEIAPQGIAVTPGKPAPDVHPDFTYAAVAAGLAEISYNNIVFTKEFGSRQRFHMVITDAEIEADPILEKSVCDECGKCAQVCPLGAISKDEYDIVEICGKEMKVAKINYSLCKACPNGARGNRFTSLAKPDRIPALCNRTCMDHLESNKLIDNVFENKFRQRKAWGKNKSGTNVDVEL